jgi:hypothetical protein
MQKSTDAATKAGKAAEDSVHLARSTAHLDQRAWVAQTEITGAPEQDQPFEVTVKFKNTGKTFAKRYSGVSALHVKQLSQPDPDFEKILAAGRIPDTIGLIPPNGTLQHILEAKNGAKISKDTLEAWKATGVILVFGRITYWDIFGCEHWTIYCYRGYVDGRWDAYGSYNDADENECP